MSLDRRNHPTDPRESLQTLSEAAVVMRARGLRKAFGGQQVLNGLNLELRQGEVVTLCGSNGSGKTTLLNVLTGNLLPDSGELEFSANGTNESFQFPARGWNRLFPRFHFSPERLARCGVGRSWQDIRLFASQSLLDNIAVAAMCQPGENPLLCLCRPRKVGRFERENRRAAETRLFDLGLLNRSGSSADRISLGQAKRVAIARAMHAQAKILYLDEPLAGLDRTGIDQVIPIVRGLAVDHKITVVIVEHVYHAARIRGFSDTIWTLENGRIEIKSVSNSKRN